VIAEVRNETLGGQHALITGGARGIGCAIAARLVELGARVTLLGRDVQALEQTAVTLRGEVGVVAADVTQDAEVRAAFALARTRFGDVQLLVNNAGVAASSRADQIDDALWQRMLAVNLTGTFHCIRAALPAMIAARAGRIVNVASTAGLIGYPYVAAYCAAKHGVIGLTRALAQELAAQGITVNAVCPGYTDTDLVRETVRNISSKTGRTSEEALAALTARNPQHRLVRPDEVANAVAWLLLPGSESINGQAIAVAGGEVT
jgi:NAD(P)-dependent dehydrogenase (short-subunit alcohol dehydrogenase family)